VTPNIQSLHVLGRLLGLLKNDLLRAETHLSDLLLSTPKLNRQREHHVDVHAVGGGDPPLFNADSSSSSSSMSSSEAMSAGALVFSFTLHSCFIGITDRVTLKCSSLSFSVASSLTFSTLNCWILLLWLGMSPGGHQRGVGAIPGMIVFKVPFCTNPGETGWSGLPNQTVRFGCCWELATALALISIPSPWVLFCFIVTFFGPFSMSGYSSVSAKVLLLDPV
jgi:hypothetical protein